MPGPASLGMGANGTALVKSSATRRVLYVATVIDMASLVPTTGPKERYLYQNGSSLTHQFLRRPDLTSTWNCASCINSPLAFTHKPLLHAIFAILALQIAKPETSEAGLLGVDETKCISARFSLRADFNGTGLGSHLPYSNTKFSRETGKEGEYGHRVVLVKLTEQSVRAAGGQYPAQSQSK
ncbi:hypothetical protein BJX63DRAFT_436506 [Aspergillus granulosus]|uniref:Uncharacterized protein n=1 Tax=Aspergillus granulosus TaxID=176169 RepID=A0ABR4GXX2_9EURO